MKQTVMNRAWEIAKEGQFKFGGNVKEYLSIAMKMAWEEVKEGKMVDKLIASKFEGLAKLNGLKDVEVDIKYWNPGNENVARIYFNVNGTNIRKGYKKELSNFYFAIKKDKFYSRGIGNATSREAVNNAIEVARKNINEIIEEYVHVA